MRDLYTFSKVLGMFCHPSHFEFTLIYYIRNNTTYIQICYEAVRTRTPRHLAPRHTRAAASSRAAPPHGEARSRILEAKEK
jgi:hypothetical protein